MGKIFDIIGGVFGSSGVSDKLLDLFKGDEAKKREFEIKLREMLMNELTKEMDDLVSARAMQTAALSQSDLFSKRFVYYLAAFLLGSTGLLSVLPFFIEIKEDSLGLINRATDFYYTVSGGSIIAFFFGAKVSR